MPMYIRQDWEPNVPHGPPVTVDINFPEFQLGSAPVRGAILDDPIVQPQTIPGKLAHVHLTLLASWSLQ